MAEPAPAPASPPPAEEAKVAPAAESKSKTETQKAKDAQEAEMAAVKHAEAIKKMPPKKSNKDFFMCFGILFFFGLVFAIVACILRFVMLGKSPLINLKRNPEYMCGVINPTGNKGSCIAFTP